MLGLVFAVGALYWFVTRTGRIRVTGCVGFCLLAGFAKQSLVAAPIAILTALVWERNWREAGLFVGAGVGVAGAVGFALIILTNGEVLKHTITYNRARGFALQWGLPQYARTLGIYGPLLGLVSIAGWQVRDQIPPIVGAYTAIGGFVDSILLLRIGASLNHALEFITGLTLLAGLVVATYDHSTGLPLQDTSLSSPLAELAGCTSGRGSFAVKRRFHMYVNPYSHDRNCCRNWLNSRQSSVPSPPVKTRTPG